MPIIGYGELEIDALTVDNRRHFVIGGGGERTILVIDGNPRGGPETELRPEAFFVEKALQVLTADLSLAIRPAAESGEVDRTDFGAYDAVLFVDAPAFSDRSAMALRTYIEQGGRAVFFLGPRVDPGNYNRYLSPDLIPGRLADSPSSPEPPVQMARRRAGHPGFDLISRERVALSEAVFESYWNVILPTDAAGSAVAWFSNDAPALIEHRLSAGTVLVFPFSPGPPWTDLPRRPSFVPFLGEILRYLLGNEMMPANLLVGDTVSLRVVDSGGGGREAVSLQIRYPDGRAETRPVTLSSGSARYYFQDLTVPGVYRFSRA
jgi:hypothetical protein